jgi:hypothetical protein
MSVGGGKEGSSSSSFPCHNSIEPIRKDEGSEE